MNIPIRFDIFDDEEEEGELRPMGPVNDDCYDPAYEFPGHGDNPNLDPHHMVTLSASSSHSIYPSPYLSSKASSPSSISSPAASNHTTVFRLIVLKSGIISRSKRIVALDGYAEVSIGRDKSPSARIRLPEMTVSKYHAAIYWDGARREWSIVDMGSMYGTFVFATRDIKEAAKGSVSVGNKADSSSGGSGTSTRGMRLSEPRKASMPKILRHLDQITIGNTTFLVHEHLDGRPCIECTIEGQGEIPLHTSSSSTSKKAVSDSTTSTRKRKSDDVVDPRKAIAKLKSNLLSQRSYSNPSIPSISDIPASSSVTSTDYKDRSAIRRQLHPEHRGMPPPPAPSISQQESARSLPASSSPSPFTTSDLGWTPPALAPEPKPTSAPISSSNIGHKLLMMQGWNPGTALGEAPDIALTEPLQLKTNPSRAGLGAGVSLATSSGDGWDWQEEARRRRWDGVRDRS